jgi:ATP-binding cassette, subfamily B, heavy metal transporter
MDMAHEDESTNWNDYRSGIRELWNTYSWVWRVLLPHVKRKDVAHLIYFLILANACSMGGPWFFGRVIDAAVRGDFSSLAFGLPLVLMACAMLGREYLLYRGAYVREIIEGNVLGEVDRQSNRLFFEKSLGQHLHEQDSLSAANIEKGRGRIQEVTKLLLFDGVEASFLLCASFTFLWITSSGAALIMTTALVIFITWSLFLNRKVAEVCVPLDAEFRAHNRYRAERWERIERVKANGKEEEEERFMSAWFDQILAKDRPFWLWFNGQHSLRGLVGIAAFLAVILYSLDNIQTHTWTLGLIYPVTTWARFIADNFWRMSYIEHRLSWNLPAIRSMKQALSLEPDVQDKPDAYELTREGGPVHLKVERLTYVAHERRGNGRPILRNVSFTVEPGKRLAIIGRKGAGKSTVMRLIQRGMDPTEGSIRINGHDLRDLKRSSWLHLVGCVLQQSTVFDGTVRDNLLYGLTPDERARTTDDELWTLLCNLGVDLEERFTDGLDTLVGRNGIKLSGGEAQCLSVAAAVAKKPLFMLIDEATSSLDSTTEKALQRGIDHALQHGAGAIIITHRLSTVRGCDQFIVLRRLEGEDSGPQIEAVGHSFEELAAVSPILRQLAKDQDIQLESLSLTA